MATAALALPDDIDALTAMVSSMRVELTAAEAQASAADALVTHLKQQIALLRRDKYGASAWPTSWSCAWKSSRPTAVKTRSWPS